MVGALTQLQSLAHMNVACTSASGLRLVGWLCSKRCMNYSGCFVERYLCVIGLALRSSRAANHAKKASIGQREQALGKEQALR